MCRNIAFIEFRAEILLTWDQGALDSRAGPFLGSVKKYCFFVEIFTSASLPPLFFGNGKIAPAMTTTPSDRFAAKDPTFQVISQLMIPLQICLK